MGGHTEEVFQFDALGLEIQNDTTIDEKTTASPMDERAVGYADWTLRSNYVLAGRACSAVLQSIRFFPTQSASHASFSTSLSAADVTLCSR